jgi:hypothetical protein
LKNIKHQSWDDAYFDGKLDPLYEDFCEETQDVVMTRKFIYERESVLQSEAKREAEIDAWYLRLHRGEVKRK